jgi:hypothetical protein
MPRLSLTIAIVCLWVGGPGFGIASAQEPAARRYAVVAIAADIQLAIIRDSRGNAHRYRLGDKLPEGGWRLVSLGAGSLGLRSEMRLRGREVDLQLREGDTFDPLAMRASLEREAEPVYRVERMVQRKPAGKRAGRD